MSIVDPDARRARLGLHASARHAPDPVNGFAFLREAYAAPTPGFDGRVTVPVLWDRETRPHRQQRVGRHHPHVQPRVRRFATPRRRLLPGRPARRDRRGQRGVYDDVNNGVYRAGFATTQAAYEEAFGALFDALDELDARLAARRYLVGDRDHRGRLAPVHDARALRRRSYVGHFKCNLRRIVDYPHLSGYLRELYQQPGIAETVDFDHIKRHYYRTHLDQPDRHRPRRPGARPDRAARP